MIIGKEDSATFIASASALSASYLSVGLSSCESFVKGIKQTLDIFLKIESYYLLIRIPAYFGCSPQNFVKKSLFTDAMKVQ